jgi:hypothetical protein
MPTEELYRGRVFTVKAWVDGDSCPVLDFLEELELNGDSDAGRLNYLIERTADHGVIKNKRQSRYLSNDIYEFKAPNTARILYFYDKGHLIICSHGFTGKPGSAQKNINNEIKQAEKIRKAYFKEKG